MCGIAGFVGVGEVADLRSMSQMLIHRGPDGEGEYVDRSKRVYLAHRRLAILDISGGAQPMWNEDRQVGVIFNGEIYNHLELREELKAKGHLFVSDHSDTEVLVHGYEEWGEGLPLRLSGMFAFAIYDRRTSRLFLARDRFGKKPIYFAAGDGFFAFASELGALIKHPCVDVSMDRTAAKKYFAYGFIPAPYSLYRGTRKLPGGCHLRYDVTSEKLRIEKYWTFRIEPAESIPKRPEAVWGEELRHLLSAAVRRRLISDVPLGVFLSGGVDSSAVLAFAAQNTPRERVKTFSIGFREASYDESRYARQIASTVGCDYSEEILSIETARELIPAILSKLDEPMGDPSILPTYLLCQHAKRHVTVALGGDGGDELFAGYDPFRALKIATWYSRVVPRWFHRRVRSLAELLPKSERNMSLDFKVRRSLRGLSYPAAVWNPIWLAPLEPTEIADLFNEPVNYEDIYDDAIRAWEQSSAHNIFDRSLEFYVSFYLQDDILTKIDRASMMVSLEVRAPFLDNDIVEFARKVPFDFKYRRGQTKYLLKKALEPILPHNIIYRQKKGFGIPLSGWLRQWRAPSQHSDMLLANKTWIDQRWEEHRQGIRDHRNFLWNWTVLERFFDSARADESQRLESRWA